MKNNYEVSFCFSGDEADVKAMRKYLFDTINEGLEVSELWDFNMRPIIGEDN